MPFVLRTVASWLAMKALDWLATKKKKRRQRRGRRR